MLREVSWPGPGKLGDNSAESADVQVPKRCKTKAVLWINLWKAWVDWRSMALARPNGVLGGEPFDSQ
jgi:hypothetical protein